MLEGFYKPLIILCLIRFYQVPPALYRPRGSSKCNSIDVAEICDVLPGDPKLAIAGTSSGENERGREMISANEVGVRMSHRSSNIRGGALALSS